MERANPADISMELIFNGYLRKLAPLNPARMIPVSPARIAAVCDSDLMVLDGESSSATGRAACRALPALDPSGREGKGEG